MANPNFPSFADFAFAVRRAAETNNRDPDRRLIVAAAATMQEGNGADGGYLVPPDLRAEVVRAVLAETSLLGRTDRQTAKSNSLVIPLDASAAWQTSGPQATPEPEGAALAQSKGVFQSRTVRLHSLKTLVPASSELFDDAVGLTAYLRAAVPARMDFKVTDWLLNGTGAGQPLGVLKSPCKITQTKEGGQAAGTVVYANVQKMWGRLHSPSKARAVWIVHSDAETALQGMIAPTGAPALVYPPDSPYGFLFGRPVLVSEAAQPLGTEGDVTLVDPLGILTATREGVVREDFSMHVFFDFDLSAFRFTMRVGGISWWAAPVARYRGGPTVSTVVTLESR
jgi:HK97 family phage major capsid protein